LNFAVIPVSCHQPGKNERNQKEEQVADTDKIKNMGARALADLSVVLDNVQEADIEGFITAIGSAKRVALHGLGREGLQMRGLAMRLFHLGIDAHVVGNMTTPPLGAGDLLIVSAGPGDFTTIEALMNIAKKAGAKTAVVTAQASGGAARRADVVLHIPAQTMANDQAGKLSVLPMGSLFEVAMMLVFELVVLNLRDRIGETPESMRTRHTNLE
jgi:6-phospho-3-hexuloisomerase